MSGDAKITFAKFLGNLGIFFLTVILATSTTLVLFPYPELAIDISDKRTDAYSYQRYPQKINSQFEPPFEEFPGCNDFAFEEREFRIAGHSSKPNDGLEPGSGGGCGGGSGGCGGARSATSRLHNQRVSSEALKLLYKARPRYTEKASKNGVQGSVRLRVDFKANGRIGKIVPIKGLPCGLTEQAIKAAKKIKFKPEKQNGKLVGVKKTVVFNFMLY